MIPVNKFSSRLGERVRLVAIHTSEGARTVESLAAFLRQDGVNASYHGAVDDHRYAAYVNYSNAAWHLRNGNQESDGLCLCAFAGWSRAEWLRHPRMLELTAAWIAERCAARNLPVRLLTPPQTGDAMRNGHHPGGVIDHDRYSKGTGDGTHWDVGPHFPFDVVIARAQHLHQEAVMPSADEVAQEVVDRLWSLPIKPAGSTQDPNRPPVPLGLMLQHWDHAQILGRTATEQAAARITAKLDEVHAAINALAEQLTDPKEPG